MVMTEEEGFRILEHPADVGIEAWGRSTAAAFEHAARGLLSVLADCSTVEPTVRREVVVNGSDSENLLVRWLSELLYLFDGERFLPADLEIVALSENALRAIVLGERVDPGKHSLRSDVKAITYHQLRVKEEGDRCIVTVYLDI